jgi:hypothetical protein
VPGVNIVRGQARKVSPDERMIEYVFVGLGDRHRPPSPVVLVARVRVKKGSAMGSATAVCEVVRRKKKRPGITAGEAHEAAAVSEDREERVSEYVPTDQEPEDTPRATIPFGARLTTEEEQSPAENSKKNRLAVTAACDPETCDDKEQLAQLIRDSHVQVVGCYRTSVEHAVRAGQYLLRAKTLVEHGEWGAWLQKHRLGFGDRTARAYMQAAESPEIAALLADPNWQPAANFTLKGLLQKLGESSGRPSRKKAESTTLTSSEVGGELDASNDDGQQEQEQTEREGDHHENRKRKERADQQRTMNLKASQTEEAAEEANEDEPVVAELDLDEDEQWLASLPLRGKLADPTIFDREATAWRRARPLLEKLNETLEITEDDHKKACLGSRYRKRLSSMIAVAVGVEEPSHWRICSMCKGRGCKSGFTTPCIECDGAGYRVTLRADRIVWNEETDDDE